MRIHVPSLPHTRLQDSGFAYCAYTQKVRRLGRMPFENHLVMTYGAGEEADVEIDNENLLEVYTGSPVWTGEKIFDIWDPSHDLWKEWNLRCINAIEARIKPGDAVGVIAGACQAELYQHFAVTHGSYPVLEWGVGYAGIIRPAFHAFESNSWRSAVLGTSAILNYYDRVIPNSYHIEEFLAAREHEGYLLYLGRLQADKGAAIVSDVAAWAKRELGMPTKVAGQGDPSLFGDVEYLGVVEGYQKAELLAGATAVLVPSLYNEPFGGVAVEAQMAGAPAITTDWACFRETVASRFRCNTLQDFIEAVQYARCLNVEDRLGIQTSATAMYSTASVSFAYDRWFSDIQSLRFGAGWTATA